MSVTTTQVETLVREIIGDPLQNGTDLFEYTTSSIFSLQEDYVYTISEVYVNQVSSGVEYSFDSSDNKITITSSLTLGDSIEIDYTYYSKYSATEIKNYVEVSLIELGIRNYGYYEVYDGTIYPDISLKEKYLIAAITAVLIEPNNKEIRTPDMTIKPPAGSLPTHKMIDKIVSIYKKNSSGIFSL